MFHLSTDRLAGLDNMILKITGPQLVPTPIPNPKKRRVPLADANNLAPACSRTPDLLFFRPLPPLPSASTLQLPSFLSLESLAPPPPQRHKVVEGPQWIPAFHHPNSPYVPWPSPVRRRILPPPSPPSFSPCIRSGAVAPEPWASSTCSQASRTKRLFGSWKSLGNSIRQRVKSVISHIGRSTRSLRTLCTGKDMLHPYDDTDIDSAIVQPHPPRATRARSRDSLASFASSDSRTLATWLAERRANASCVTDHIVLEMSVEEYELIGSWLDLRQRDGGWLCGVQNCDMHTAGGSPCVANAYPSGLRTAMPFDNPDLLSAKRPLPSADGSFSASPRFHSLPRLPCQSFDIHSAQGSRPTTAERCTTRCRERSMPGGWTF